MLRRPRRNRKNPPIRGHQQETILALQNLIYPLFVVDGQQKQEPIPSMPGAYRYSVDTLLQEVEQALSLGLRTFILFPAVEDQLKDATASYSYHPDNFYLKAIQSIKQQFPEACVVTDVAMDPYSSDGHDGLVRDGQVVNDDTLPILAKMALAQADAGADILGPSDMMDGRVGYIRDALDSRGHQQVSIMAYTAKYATAYYGPFRDALASAPEGGSKADYQMDPANQREALEEAHLDYQEGAAYLMVKPDLHYLDVVYRLNDTFHMPIAAYHVSGEYAMLKAAAQQGWLNYNETMAESLLSIRRAGARAIITYAAKDYAELVQTA
jgi:porphobilinogen synthase